jgi:phosphoglycerate kinase
MRSIKEIKNLKAKKVIVRVDFNVPIEEGKVKDDFRIRFALPTIAFLLKKGAEVILMTHLGENGDQDISLVKKHFFKISKMPKNKIIFFENLRKFKGEKENDLKFAKELAKMGDIYVNEAFSVSHRKHASVVSLPKYLPGYIGLGFEKEIKNLSRAFENPKHPFLFILGGAKFSTKIPLIKKYLKLADYVFVGGALANSLLKERGHNVGKSLVDENKIKARGVLSNKKLILPDDFVVKNEMIIDMGEKSVQNLSMIIKKSKLVLWNGPLGKYEDGGASATKKILKLLAISKAESIIGGGDTVSLVSKMKMQNKFSFVSTGGGATLEFLAKGTLPGIKALK